MHWLNMQRWKNVIFEKGKSSSVSIGCTSSMGWKKKKNIPEVTIFVPELRVPVRSDDLQKILRGVLPTEVVDKISCLRNQIVLVAEDTGGSAIPDLQQALEEYLSLLVGVNRKEECEIQKLVEFKWKNLSDGRQEVCVQNWWFEVYSVIHMMATLTLTEANSILISKDQSTGSDRIVSSDSMRNAVELLLKAAGYLELLIRDVLIHLPPDIRSRLPNDLNESTLEAIIVQALAQGTEMQLGLAVESRNATLSVKRRLACEQLSYLGQAHCCLSTSNNNQGYGKKHMLFIKWKYLEAKAAAYYYNGLMLDKGTEPASHISAVCCFLAAENLLAESKKACLSFCLAVPVTRPPPIWGAMKNLNKKIPEIASRKSQMYGYLMEQEKGLQILPDLPEFQLSLKPEDYQLPEPHLAWDTENMEITWQTPNEQLVYSEDDIDIN
ncbi:uncharacterized protein LOC108218353 [Daucus carota subsp. sativus]|nr:PREDICTED: uncharacterized protein LOC108218353 [Daucus carota subsp. sativus]XP_017246756.1 PREDICTED: uncharacterized protein LOC108218353 [Daucus carota subsp. sativus]XP_017246757.1 PREDICTED: uncharacterized protein LOC108218353 [Daucus carota subsp. sativus]XP_017246758.1 PREDICTED: uncharacterized protein LOC108218353 [Daucus carota subsp. sativus]